MSELPLLTTIAHQARQIIEAAERDGLTIDDGNVVDLLADNLSDLISLSDIRAAIVVAGFAPRFPKATRVD